MTLPFLWIDDLAKRGWLAVLSGAEVKVLWCIGAFYFVKTEQAKTDSLMLQRLTGLSPSGFYEARGRLLKFGLIEVAWGTRRGKYRDYRTHIYRLVNPLPPLPPDHESARAERYSRRQDDSSLPGRKVLSARAEGSVRQGGQADGANAHRRPLSAPRSTTAKTQLEQALETTGSKALEPVIFSRLPEVAAEVVELVSSWAAVVQRSPTSRKKMIGDAVAAITRRFPDLPTADVREAVNDAAAVLHPVLQHAVQLFDGRVIEVRKVEA